MHVLKNTINQDPLDYCGKKNTYDFQTLMQNIFRFMSLGNLHLSLSSCPCPQKLCGPWFDVLDLNTCREGDWQEDHWGEKIKDFSK